MQLTCCPHASSIQYRLKFPPPNPHATQKGGRQRSLPFFVVVEMLPVTQCSSIATFPTTPYTRNTPAYRKTTLHASRLRKRTTGRCGLRPLQPLRSLRQTAMRPIPPSISRRHESPLSSTTYPIPQYLLLHSLTPTSPRFSQTPSFHYHHPTCLYQLLPTQDHSKEYGTLQKSRSGEPFIISACTRHQDQTQCRT